MCYIILIPHHFKKSQTQYVPVIIVVSEKNMKSYYSILTNKIIKFYLWARKKSLLAFAGCLHDTKLKKIFWKFIIKIEVYKSKLIIFSSKLTHP